MSGSVNLYSSIRHTDDRGWFSETYSDRKLSELGVSDLFVQDNHSFSTRKYTLRGLHFQTPPHGQAKLVRCVRGTIFDVAVDVRANSPTFGQWIGAELTAQGGEQLYIPVGFAHGFLTLEERCEVIYKCSDYYAPSNDGGIRWDDPHIAVEWPIPQNAAPILSSKDAALPLLAAFVSPFSYDGVPLGALV